MAIDELRSTGDSAAPPVPRRVFEVRGAEVGAWRRFLPGAELRAEAESRASALLLDSFDRRLRRAGLDLAVLAEEPRVVCRLSPAGRAASSSDGTFELERLPVFAWDFPGAAAQRLAGMLEARAIRPIGKHELTRARFAVLDDQAKTVAWVEEERHEVGGERAHDTSVRRLVLQGVRGYDEEFERLGRELERVPGLVAVPDTDFDASELLVPARRAAGRWPELPADVHAYAGLARIARAQLAVVRANAVGTRAGEDAEYLHDTRVALRRLRSLLAQLKGVLAAEEHAHLAGELRWLAACTGPARDLDTLLFELRLTEPALRADLEPALVAFEHERARLQVQLCSELRGARARALLARLRERFSGADGTRRAGPQAERPFAHLLAKRLGRRQRQVVRRARALDAHGPAAELHELRIACKKLRYLLECCRGFVPRAELAGAFAHLKDLQGALGSVQDAEVHGRLVRELAQSVSAAAGPRAHLALGRFLERVEHAGRTARERYAGLAASFLAPDSRAAFESIQDTLAHAPERARPRPR